MLLRPFAWLAAAGALVVGTLATSCNSAGAVSAECQQSRARFKAAIAALPRTCETVADCVMEARDLSGVCPEAVLVNRPARDAAKTHLDAERTRIFESCPRADVQCEPTHMEPECRGGTCVDALLLPPEPKKPASLTFIPVDGRPEAEQRADCEARGGRWGGVTRGRGRMPGCNPKTSDGGKACDEPEDCEGGCVRGACSDYLRVRGCGLLKRKPDGSIGQICLD